MSSWISISVLRGIINNTSKPFCFTVLEVEQFGVELLKPQVSDILTYIQKAIKNIKGHGKKSQAAGKELSILSRYV